MAGAPGGALVSPDPTSVWPASGASARSRIAFTPEAARRRVEASGPIPELSVGIEWRAAVRLQSPLAGRTVVDRGVPMLEPPLPAPVIARLEGD